MTASETKHFKTSRGDGRSDRQVVYDFVVDASPDTIFSFDELRAVLERDTPRRFSNASVSASAREANGQLLKFKQRTLVSVKGVGYRIARAAEHNGVALQRHKRADNQLAKGVEVLSNVCFEEMTPVQRQVHEGTMLIVGALYNATRSIHQRQDKMEKVLASLVATKN